MVFLFLTHGIYRNKKSNDFIVIQKYFQLWIEILINLLQFLKNDEESWMKIQKKTSFKYMKAF